MVKILTVITVLLLVLLVGCANAGDDRPLGSRFFCWNIQHAREAQKALQTGQDEVQEVMKRAATENDFHCAISPRPFGPLFKDAVLDIFNTHDGTRRCLVRVIAPDGTPVYIFLTYEFCKGIFGDQIYNLGIEA